MNFCQLDSVSTFDVTNEWFFEFERNQVVVGNKKVKLKCNRKEYKHMTASNEFSITPKREVLLQHGRYPEYPSDGYPCLCSTVRIFRTTIRLLSTNLRILPTNSKAGMSFYGTQLTRRNIFVKFLFIVIDRTNPATVKLVTFIRLVFAKWVGRGTIELISKTITEISSVINILFILMSYYL